MEEAVVMIDSTTGRARLLNRSDRIDCEGARPALSPMAIAKRVRPSCQTLLTIPVRAVIRLQKARPMATMLRRLHRSASQATGTPRMA